MSGIWMDVMVPGNHVLGLCRHSQQQQQPPVWQIDNRAESSCFAEEAGSPRQVQPDERLAFLHCFIC